MATLITVRTTTGKLLGTCDERCYLAQHDHCACVCGGVCHGIGLQRAAAAALKLTDPDPAGFREKYPPWEAVITKHPRLLDWAHPRLFADA